MRQVTITGAASPLGRRAARALLDAGTGVTGIDGQEPVELGATGAAWQFGAADVERDDLKPLVDGSEVVVHLAVHPYPRRGRPEDFAEVARRNVAATQRVLDAAAACGARHLVVSSSATVYGAWADNPVPLTEDAPLRPNPGFDQAAEKAELERLVAEWAEDHPSTTVCVLRPAALLGEPGVRTWLAHATRPALADRLGHTVPARQFVHIDDVAAAIAHAVTHGLEGTYNVGPDGWLAGDDADALAGPRLPFPLPDRVTGVVAALARAAGRRRSVPGATPYRRAPWVIASDRLRASGWRPLSTSEEAFVASRRPSRLGRLVSRRRQEVTLAAVAGAGLAVAGAVAVVVRRRLRATRRG